MRQHMIQIPIVSLLAPTFTPNLTLIAITGYALPDSLRSLASSLISDITTESRSCQYTKDNRADPYSGVSSMPVGTAQL